MRARVSTRTMATGSPVGRAPMSGTWATTPSELSSARSTTRPSAEARPVSMARRSWSLPRARVITAPGSTVAGRSASGRRTSGAGGGGVGGEVGGGSAITHVSKDID